VAATPLSGRCFRAQCSGRRLGGAGLELDDGDLLGYPLPVSSEVHPAVLVPAHPEVADLAFLVVDLYPSGDGHVSRVLPQP
jgi:hypothetical protein